MKRAGTLIVVLLLSIYYSGHNRQTAEVGVEGNFIVPGLPKKRIVKLEDINFGVQDSFVYDDGDLDEPCRGEPRVYEFPEEIYTSYNVTTIMAYWQVVAYAVERVNNMSLLPNNLTLGFVYQEDCGNKHVSAAQSLAYVPQTSCSVPATENNSQEAYDVVAVIGGAYSSTSSAIANVLGVVKIPQVSVYAASDQLSDTERYPYFMRLTPSNRLQIEAISQLIYRHRWTYVSVVYSSDNFGQSGYELLSRQLENSSVCLAVVKSIYGWSNAEGEDIAKDLVEEHERARVVVLIVKLNQARPIIRATGHLLPNKTFIWLGTAGWAKFAASMYGIRHLLLDSFLIMADLAEVDGYDEWFVQRTANSSGNPWFSKIWERYYQCSLKKGTCNINATDRVKNIDIRSQALVRGYIVDAVTMIANATSRVLQNAQCSLTGSAARKCVNSHQLLEEMEATRQLGFSGWLELDENGDRQGLYLIKQLRRLSAGRYEMVRVYEFSTFTHNLTSVNNVTWTNGSLDPNLTTRMSVCSLPCRPHEVRIVQAIKCCWVCKRCNAGEYLNGSHCLDCPRFHWPDPNTNYTTCYSIEPDSPAFSNVLGILQTSIATIGILVCLVVLGFFCCQVHAGISGAGYKQLSFLMLIAIMVGYMAMILALLHPTTPICKVRFMLFCTSITTIFACFIARVLYIKRLSIRGHKSAGVSPKTDTCRQLVHSSGLLFVQVVVCILVVYLCSDWYRLTQQNVNKKYVELTCAWPEVGLISFACYNLALVLICSVLSFRARRLLTDSYQECPIIFLCCCMCIVIWLCFIPAFIVAAREFIKTMILVLSLFLIHSTVLIFFFLSKFYAALYGTGARLGPVPTFSVSQEGQGLVRKTEGTFEKWSLQDSTTFKKPDRLFQDREMFPVGERLSCETSLIMSSTADHKLGSAKSSGSDLASLKDKESKKKSRVKSGM